MVRYSKKGILVESQFMATAAVLYFVTLIEFVCSSLQVILMNPESKFLVGSEDCLHLNVFSPQMPGTELDWILLIALGIWKINTYNVFSCFYNSVIVLKYNVVSIGSPTLLLVSISRQPTTFPKQIRLQNVFFRSRKKPIKINHQCKVMSTLSLGCKNKNQPWWIAKMFHF